MIVGEAKKFLDPLKQRFGNVEVIPAAELDLNLAGLRKNGSVIVSPFDSR